MNRRNCLILSSAALSAFQAGVAKADLTADQTPFNGYRGIWIDRFDYSVSNTNTIRTAIQNSAQLGFTDVMFQVRGQADSYYFNNNGLETLAANVSATRDPLKIALDAAGGSVRVHAWINAMPLWNGTNGAPASHMYSLHPEWRTKGANGVDQPLNSGYVIANPATNGFRLHLNQVVSTIATNYSNVAGVHLDYIRLYNSNPGATNVIEYPSDPATVALFQQQYPGQTPQSNPANYKAWLADQITTLVGEMRTTLKNANPKAQLTAAVWRDADIGLDEYQQDWARWIDSGLLDAAMPMIYRKGFGSGTGGTNVDSMDYYRNNVAEATDRRGTAGIMAGLGTYMQDDAATAYANTMAQLNYAKQQGANGIQVFDYTIFNGTAAQNEVKRALTDFFAANNGPASTTTLADFEVDEGPLKWSITLSGSNQNVAATSTADRDVTQSHTGIGAQKIVINRGAANAPFLARHVSSNGTAAGSVATFENNTQFATIGSVGFWLKSDSADLQVALAPDDPTTGERSYFQNVIADGQWHKYEWFLADPTHWDVWAGGVGHLGNIATLDSIQFIGTGLNNTIYLDDVFHNPGAIAANQWTFNNPDGAWSHSGNWTGGAPNAVGATANLLRRATAARTIVLDKAITLGTLNIDNAQSYTIGGTNALSMDVVSGSAGINVINRGQHSITAPLALKDNTNVFVDRGSQLTIGGTLNNAQSKSLTKVGDGTLHITGAQTHGAGSVFSAAGGTTRFASNGGTNLTVVASANIVFDANQSLAGLGLAEGGKASLTAGRKTVSVRSFSSTGSGQLDLNDGGLIVDYTVNSALADVRAKLVGGGIVSTATNAATALGYGEASTVLGISGTQTASFMGASVDASSVLVRWTVIGDANLSGDVGFSDLLTVSANFGEAGDWSEGDFDLDGNVTFADLVKVASAFGNVLPAEVPGASVEFNEAWKEAVASVPEPGAGLVGMMAAGWCARRRRRA